MRGCIRLLWSFLKTLSMGLPISWWVIYKAPVHTWVFDQKCHDFHAPPSLFTQSRLEWLFFCFPNEKSPQREMFCQCGRGETKNSRSIKIDKFKNCFEQWRKCLDRCILHQMGRALWRGLKVKHVRINTQFFINKFCCFGVPPLYIIVK